MDRQSSSLRRRLCVGLGALLVGITVLNAPMAFAQGRPDDRESHGNSGKNKGHERNESDHGNRGNDKRDNYRDDRRGNPFGSDERREVVAYYGHLPPGQVKKGRIPPGFQARPGVYLPVGYGEPLPVILVKRLPPRPGYERVVVGSDVLLIEAATRVIVDILTGAAN